jgi:hypothetical protein
MRTPTLLICALSIGQLACGDTTSAASATNEMVGAERLERPNYRPWTVGAEASTTGFGASGAWRFSHHLGVRLGANYFQYSYSEAKLGDLHYDVSARFLSEPLTLDIYPWARHSFHISVGMLFNQNQLTGTLSDSGTLVIDGIPFPSADVVPVNLKVDQEPVNPYLGIGGNLFYFDRAHRWALGGELGVAYTGEPQVSLSRSGPSRPLIDAALSREQDNIKDDLEQYRWYPVVKLMVNFSF